MASARNDRAQSVGAYPANYDTDALPQRRLASYARIISIVAAVEGMAIVSLSLAIAAIMPLQKVVPMVVTANPKGDEIIHVNPLTLDSPSAQYLTEIALRKYITDRYSIIGDSNAQMTLWGANSSVQMQSSPEVYKKFIEKAQPEYDAVRGRSMVRNVRINQVSAIGENTWQVEYTTVDETEQNPMTPAGPVTGKSWVATISLKFEPKNVTYSQRLVNPLGLTVVNINEAARD